MALSHWEGEDFGSRLCAWQKRYGRHLLPWQASRDPYAVWVSEIMLQQTQVGTVIPYYIRFMKRFPDVLTLARAREDSVLRYWSGLGYYSRARNLQKGAKRVRDGFGGRFPRKFEDVCSIPGVGRSTAAAVCVFAFGQRHPILDGNVKRVLARWFGVEGYPGLPRVEAVLLEKAQVLLPERQVRVYTQGLMDLGAGVCTPSSPDCAGCPVAFGCRARIEDRTREIPTPKKQVRLPEKTAVMAVMMRGEDVFLEKRGTGSVWPGLWSFPEAPDRETVEGLLDLRSESGVPLAPMTHVFTHFRLHIQPVMYVVPFSEEKKNPGRLRGKWLRTQSALQRLGLPAPVKKILKAITA